MSTASILGQSATSRIHGIVAYIAGRHALTVEELLAEAERLRRDEQLRLVDGILRLLQEPQATTRSITELRGLGKHVWEGIDARDYVRRERDSWAG